MTSGTIDPEAPIAILEGNVSGKSLLGGRDKDGDSLHTPGGDVKFSAPKLTSLARPVHVDHEIQGAHANLARPRCEPWSNLRT